MSDKSNNDILLKEIQKIYGTPTDPQIKKELEEELPTPVTLEEPKTESSDIDDILNNIPQSELKNNTTEILELKDENLDQFILNHAGQMVKDSVEYIKELKEHFQLNSTPDEIKAFSAAVEASAAAIESLNKMSITRQKIKAAKELKEMDTKLKLEEKDNDKITFTRDQLFEMIMSKKKQEGIQDEPIDLDVQK